MKRVQRSLLLTTLLFLGIAASARAQTPRIDPAGIPGALLLCGSGGVAPAAVEKFFGLAGGDKASIVVLTFALEMRDKKTVARLTEFADKEKYAPIKVVPLQAGVKLKEVLASATGVWLTGEMGTDEWTLVERLPLEKACRDLLQRSGVLGLSGDAVDLAASCQFGLRRAGLPSFGLLPDSLIATTRQDLLKKEINDYPNLVGYAIEIGAAMLVQGRTISAVGAKKTTIYVGSRIVPTRVIELQGKHQEDLTALRRCAVDRAKPFPPREVELPVVEKGTLVIVGGGGSPDGLYKKFVEYAGGEGKANIVIFPTANPEPLPKQYLGFTAAWKKAGARKVTVLPGRTQAEVESKEFLDTLKEATGLWFDGGRQWRFVDCYENTKALPLMFDVLARGGVIGGTSAGATIQGEYLARGGVFNNVDIRYEGYERGLGFLKGVAIDQHFSQRKRQPEMTQLMKVYPQYLGIGLDEATAIVVKGSTAEVIGKGKAHFYDANRKVEKGNPDYEALTAGGRYDLKERKVLAGVK